MKVDDLTVTITAVDEVSPVLRRIYWNLWLYRHGPAVIGGLLLIVLTLAVALAFVLGRVSA